MNLFITGTTGFLGGELLIAMSKRNDIEKIYCLVRATDYTLAIQRLQKVFNLHNDYFDSKKIIPVMGDLGNESLAKILLQNEELKCVDTIIHSAANTSFTRIYDDLVEQINIEGTKKLLEWASQLPNLKQFVYIGTATICGADVKNTIVKEHQSPNIAAKHLVKYSYTKMIGEMLLKTYLSEDKILVLRPSIIMGDSRDWEPRSYVILWALATLNELRLIPITPNSKIDIISIDYATEAIVRLVMSSKRKYNVYHISSGQQSHTTPQLVINSINKYFTDKPPYVFVKRAFLSNLKKWVRNANALEIDNELHSYQTYLDYWIKNFGNNTKLRILFYALEPYIDFIELNQIFDNTRMLEDSGLEKPIPAHIYMQHSGKYLTNINIFEGAIDA
jgi:thioester reductase-like protein